MAVEGWRVCIKILEDAFGDPVAAVAGALHAQVRAKTPLGLI